MTYKATHQNVEFIAAVDLLSDLQSWYQSLPENDIKAAITKVKCRHYCLFDGNNYRLTVLCSHRFLSQPENTINRSPSDAPSMIPEFDSVMPAFTDWISHYAMPGKIMLGTRNAMVEWLPEPTPPQLLTDKSPEEQVRWEMDTYLLECLELIKLSATTDKEFAETWQSTNEPFFAAGRLMYGDFRWIREVSLDFIYHEMEVHSLLERVGEFSREFVGLMRLASVAGAESPLLERVLAVIQRLKLEHPVELHRIVTLANQFLDGGGERYATVKPVATEQQEEIIMICDRLRKNLIEATRGFEEEIAVLINGILPTLQAPPSAVLFSDQAEL